VEYSKVSPGCLVNSGFQQHVTVRACLNCDTYSELYDSVADPVASNPADIIMALETIE
jgi:hypothetical protein